MFGDRLKLLRKALNLSQKEFADRLGIRNATISNYEIGRNEPVDSVYRLIVREFRVNEAWLRSGEGEMFASDDRAVIDRLREALPNLIDDAARVVEMFAELPVRQQEQAIEFLRRISEELTEKDELARIHEEVDSEFDAEKNPAEKSAG